MTTEPICEFEKVVELLNRLANIREKDPKAFEMYVGMIIYMLDYGEKSLG